ncbi:MAG: hypothetical protein J7507_15405, partial [Pseudoxanthomonas sp.]|nr:hypothetical protein [Pseudoxanthomonas sp.]
MRYEDLYRRSIEQPEAFWADAATAIDWQVPPQAILEYTNPPFRRWRRRRRGTGRYARAG